MSSERSGFSFTSRRNSSLAAAATLEAPDRILSATVRQPPQTLVVGGGIVGLCCAHVLSERGRRVEVLEATEPGAGASGAAAGMISPLVESDFDPEFSRVCRTARDLWPAWAEWLAGESGVDVSFSSTGTLLPAYSSRDLSFLDQVQQDAEDQAENWERWEPEQVREAQPDLRDGVLSALYLPNEFSVDPPAVLRALRRVLLQRGVPIHSGRTVRSVQARSRTVEVVGEGWSTECDQVVLAAGSGTAWIDLPGNLPVRAVRGQMISYRLPVEHGSPTIRTSEHYALSRAGELLIGATVEDVGFDDSTTDEGRQVLRDVALDLFPRLQWKAIARHWAGLRPTTPDNLPLLGAHDHERVILATGHYRNGVLLAPWTARVVADLLAHGRSTELPEAFSPQRFETSSRS